jgi:hypothetical protein
VSTSVTAEKLCHEVDSNHAETASLSPHCWRSWPSGEVKDRVAFILDEAARLGNMSLLEVARDAGRKYAPTTPWPCQRR